MEPGFLPLLWRSLIGLAAVLGLFAFVVWGMRRFQGGALRQQGDFRILRRLHLDNRHSIVEIRHQQRLYLLALSPGGLRQLSPDQAMVMEEHDAESAAASAQERA